jgi:tRNA(adenine34) deaminase
MLLCLGASTLPASLTLAAFASGEQARHFVAEAERMRREAIASGDQPFGAVVVRNGQIVGYGPSRVVVDRNLDAHAERVAIRDAQKRLGTRDLTGAVMYSTSRPCSACETAAALANLDRMYYGPSATDAGKPQRR